jgi:hypothetical protein
MTVEELEKAVEGRKLARHRGQVFFTVYDEKEAKAWKKKGANVRIDLVGTLGEVIPGRTFWEVHVYAMLDPDSHVSEDGTEIDLRPQKVLEHFRERDGFDTSESLFR